MRHLPRAAALALLVLAAHFLPPERAALSPDDLGLARAVQQQGLPAKLLAVTGLKPRPLGHALAVLLVAATYPSPGLGAALLALVSVAAALLAWCFFRAVLDEDSAFAAACVWVLLPNKLELFHTSMYTWIQAMHALHLAALALALRALRAGARLPLLGALACFGAACLMNEVGLLLPLVVQAWAWALALPRRHWLLAFAAPLVLFGVVYAVSFGQPAAAGGTQHVAWGNVPHNLFLSAPSFFAGRHLMRPVAYGIGLWPALPPGWLALALVLDAALLGAAWQWLGRIALPAPPRPILLAAAATMALFLGPNLLYVIEGRHLALADLGFALLVVAGLRSRPRLGAGLLAVLLVVGQGVAWTQVVAGRIQAATFAAVRARAEELRAARLVVFDLASFAEHIPYTWGEREDNVMKAYYGAQVFAGWGLLAMVRLSGCETPVAASRAPVAARGEEWTFDTWSREPKRAPRAGTVVIGYRDVYPCGFEAGRARPCP